VVKVIWFDDLVIIARKIDVRRLGLLKFWGPRTSFAEYTEILDIDV
jgi:hypothetical protein